MPLISVTALRPFLYRNRSVKVGESVPVAPLEAASLVYQRKAKFTVVLRPRTPEPKPARSPRQSYKRRDLQADE